MAGARGAGSGGGAGMRTVSGATLLLAAVLLVTGADVLMHFSARDGYAAGAVTFVAGAGCIITAVAVLRKAWRRP